LDSWANLFCRGGHGTKLGHAKRNFALSELARPDSLTFIFLDGLTKQKTSLSADHVVTKSEAVHKS
jgi:hypothetical protein